jgi:hypothetical protein
MTKKQKTKNANTNRDSFLNKKILQLSFFLFVEEGHPKKRKKKKERKKETKSGL